MLNLRTGSRLRVKESSKCWESDHPKVSTWFRYREPRAIYARLRLDKVRRGKDVHSFLSITFDRSFNELRMTTPSQPNLLQGLIEEIKHRLEPFGLISFRTSPHPNWRSWLSVGKDLSRPGGGHLIYSNAPSDCLPVRRARGTGTRLTRNVVVRSQVRMNVTGM